MKFHSYVLSYVLHNFQKTKCKQLFIYIYNLFIAKLLNNKYAVR